jgi:hypothetical protein
MIEQSSGASRTIRAGIERPGEATSPIPWTGWYWLALAAAVPAGIMLTWVDGPWWRDLLIYCPAAQLLGRWQRRTVSRQAGPRAAQALLLAATAVVLAVALLGQPPAGLSWYTLAALVPAVPCLLTARVSPRARDLPARVRSG